jgi:hypothetical protein
MRFLVGSILALIAVVFVQSAPVVRQTGGPLGELQVNRFTFILNHHLSLS